MTDKPIAHTKDGRPLYDNTNSVVCVKVINTKGEILVIRRGNNPGKGKIALPGGYQMRGETWQYAGFREVYEETNIKIVEPPRIKDVITDEYQNNVILCESYYKGLANPVPQEGEVEEAFWVNPRVLSFGDWAFPVHYNFSLSV